MRLEAAWQNERVRVPTVSARRYRRLAEVSLVLLTLIVLTGAAVRLTGSGLGCPDWPRCYGRVVPPLEFHAWTEFGNRLLSGVIGIVVAAAGVLAWRRRPFRRDLALIGSLLPVGVAAQAVLGGFTVRNHLEPGFVIGHFLLSMVLLVLSFALAYRARREPGEHPPHLPARAVWAVRALLAWGTVVLIAGTVATASGPHAGSAGTGEIVNRLDFRGVETLEWAIKWHGRTGTVLGLGLLAAFFWLRRRGATRELQAALAVSILLVGAQGVIGGVQYLLALPAELVWLHVAVATFTWLALLWAVGAAGRPRPGEPPPAPEPPAPAAEQTLVAS